VKIGRITVAVNLSKKFTKPPSQPMAGYGGTYLSSLPMHGSTNRAIMVHDSLGINNQSKKGQLSGSCGTVTAYQSTNFFNKHN
jgi:hypothetical protein